MTHGALYKLGMHPENEYAYLEERVNLFDQMLRSQMKEEEKSRAKSRTLKGIQQRILVMQERQRALLKKKVEGVTFEQIGLTCLFTDECQFYKNLGLPVNTEGFNVTPARRAVDMEMKLRYLERNNGDQPFGAFFSATPWANNLIEAYVMMYYLSYGKLKQYGLDSADAFIANFVDISTQVEVSADGSTFQQKTRARGFFNFVDLMDILKQVADIQPPEILDGKRPQLVPQTIPIEPTPEMVKEVQSLVRRADDIHNAMHANWEGKEDNMLRIVTRGRQLAVSPRLCGLSGRSVKVEAVSKKVFDIWQRCQRNPMKLAGEHQSLQIIFCDMGCPTPDKGDQVYGEVKRVLIALGMSTRAIRFIHEAKNDAQKADLFQKCRAGEVAVLMGSTEKLGTGTNVQDRCVAIHMMAPPWRPDMIAQCIGRAHRPGNSYATVYMYNYVVAGTFDAYMWQTLERKAHFMAQLLAGTVTDREMDIESEMEITYREVKAAATGDELVLEQASIDMEVARLQRLGRVYMQARERDRHSVLEQRRIAQTSRERVANLKILANRMVQCQAHGFSTLEQKQIEDRQEAGLYIMQQVFALLLEGKHGSRQIGNFSGVSVALRVQGEASAFTAEILLQIGLETAAIIRINPLWMRSNQQEEGEETQEKEGKNEKPKEDDLKGPQQWRITYAIEQLLSRVTEEEKRSLEDAERAEKDAETYEAQAKVPFPQEATFRRLMARKMAIDAYTERVASGKLSEEEAVALRREVLAGAMREYSRDLTINARQQEEVFALTMAAREALAEAMETSSIGTLFDQVQETFSEPVPIVDRVPAQASLDTLTRVAEQQIESMELDQLLAVSLFDGFAPRSVQRQGRQGSKKRTPGKKEASPMPTPATIQESLFSSLL
jgi:hypothetical protein